MDSWMYAALDRLASFGLIPSQTSGLRPWTRAECLRQVREAGDRLSGPEAPGAGVASEASRLLDALHAELDGDSAASGVVLQSLYSRNGVIAGPVLNDSFHFGQTWTNDYGRPFGRGWNSYEGFTARAWSGRFFAYVNGEVQHAPGSPALSLPVRQTVASLDGVPLQPAGSAASITRFRALDAYAGVRLGDLEFSAGKQTLWWGPTHDAPLSFSNNAEPTKNLRISTVHPIRFGGVLRYFGDIRGEFVIGKLGGHQYTWRPWFNAQKLSFKLTENLEMGFTRWSIFWGVGHPITLRSFIRNFISTNSPRDCDRRRSQRSRRPQRRLRFPLPHPRPAQLAHALQRFLLRRRPLAARRAAPRGHQPRHPSQPRAGNPAAWISASRRPSTTPSRRSGRHLHLLQRPVP